MTTSVKGGLRPAWNLGRVLLAGLVLLLPSGKIRGPEPDRLARESIKWLYAESTTVLSPWCHQNLASLFLAGMLAQKVSPDEEAVLAKACRLLREDVAELHGWQIPIKGGG